MLFSCLRTYATNRCARRATAGLTVGLVVGFLLAEPAGALTINVEVDWMEGSHSHQPSQSEIDAAVAMFACEGHILNVIVDEAIPHYNVIPRNPGNCGLSLFSYSGSVNSFGQLSATYFDHAGMPGWHYCIFAHQYEDSSCNTTTSSGLAQINGTNFIVTLGAFSFQIGTPWDRAGTFVHELGHNLGLRHAGLNNTPNWKPNFASVMNYRYQLLGVQRGMECYGLFTTGPPFRQLDYSHGTLADLPEANLIEADGIGFGAVDWDCDGSIDASPVAQNLTVSNWCPSTGGLTLLTDYNDWANIVAPAARSAEGALPVEESELCITAEEARDLLRGGCVQPTPTAAEPCTTPADCNSNGVHDITDIAEGTSTDCNANFLPDECEGLPDCQSNGVPDVCDIVLGTDVDCNVNAVPDGCDISSGTSDDTDPDDGVPDECQASVLFVDANGGTLRGGTSWANAMTDLEDALAVASNPANAVSEIWVAAATYRPDDGSGDRSATFNLSSGVSVYGGFAGTETLLSERDPAVNVTILSGDIGTPADSSDNSYHVVTADNSDATGVLDGFTITLGNADGVNPDDRGGGMLINDGSPTITNINFVNNSASFGGGAYGAGGAGPLFSHCDFIDNSAGNNGGGLYTNNNSAFIVNCRFLNNSAGSRGGGFLNAGNGTPILVNGLFSGNSANQGGGFANFGAPTTANSSFTANSATAVGGGVYNIGGGSSLNLQNCVLWNNSDNGGTDESAQVHRASGSVTANYSCIQGLTGGLGGVGNIGTDPLFEDADGADNTAGTADDDLRLQAGSPAIDAGDNSAVPGGVTTDLDDNARFVDDPDTTDSGNGTPPIVDMGAYEFQAVPTCTSTCGDIDGSGGNVNLVDFASFAVCFGGSPSSSPACACSDLNLDGAINLLDFATFSLIFNGTSTNVLPNCP